MYELLEAVVIADVGCALVAGAGILPGRRSGHLDRGFR